MINLLSPRKKFGGVLVQNVIFIILNLIFVSMLIFFIWNQSGSAALLEETYAKKSALALDSAQPPMDIKIGMHDALEIANKNNFDFSKAVSVKGNVVRVKLREKGGHKYSFFNDINVTSVYPERNVDNQYTGNYVFVVKEVQGIKND